MPKHYKISCFILFWAICLGTSTQAQDTDNFVLWPGDINNNGEVNHVDLLYLGVAYSHTGEARNQQTGNWGAYLLPDTLWTYDYMNGLNFSYADCNGDGIVNIFDLMVIESNYGQDHIPVAADMAPEAMMDLDPQFSFGIETVIVEEGQEVSILLRLGTEDNPVDAFHGVAFSIDYNLDYIVPGSVSFETVETWMASDVVHPILSIENDDALTSTMEVATTQTTGVSQSGSGIVGKLSFIIIDDVPDVVDDEIIRIEQIFMADEFLNITPVQGTSLNVEVLTNGDNVLLDLEDIQLYPNPILDGAFQLELPTSLQIAGLTLYDISGKEQAISVNESDGRMEIQTGEIPLGMYILEIKTPKGSLHKKVFVSEQ